MQSLIDLIKSWFGVQTVKVQPLPKVNEPEVVPKPVDKYFGAPWMKFMFDRLGWTEFNHDKELSEGWKYVGLPQFKTVIGSTYAWCSMIVQSAFRSVGLKGSGSAMAASYRAWSKQAGGMWFGAPISFQHPNGSNHTGFWVCWYDKSKNLALVCSGNSNNELNLTVYDFNKEREFAPRWPDGHPDGKEITLEQFKAVWPNVKIRGSGSTR